MTTSSLSYLSPHLAAGWPFVASDRPNRRVGLLHGLVMLAGSPTRGRGWRTFTIYVLRVFRPCPRPVRLLLTISAINLFAQRIVRATYLAIPSMGKDGYKFLLPSAPPPPPSTPLLLLLLSRVTMGSIHIIQEDR